MPADPAAPPSEPGSPHRGQGSRPRPKRFYPGLRAQVYAPPPATQVVGWGAGYAQGIAPAQATSFAPLGAGYREKDRPPSDGCSLLSHGILSVATSCRLSCLSISLRWIWGWKAAWFGGVDIASVAASGGLLCILLPSGCIMSHGTLSVATSCRFSCLSISPGLFGFWNVAQSGGVDIAPVAAGGGPRCILLPSGCIMPWGAAWVGVRGFG